MLSIEDRLLSYPLSYQNNCLKTYINMRIPPINPTNIFSKINYFLGFLFYLNVSGLLLIGIQKMIEVCNYGDWKASHEDIMHFIFDIEYFLF